MIRDDARWSMPLGAYILTCLQCQHNFTAKRRDAKYCSVNCRKAAARRTVQLQRAADKAIAEIASIRQQAQRWPELEIATLHELNRILKALVDPPSRGGVTHNSVEPEQSRSVE